MTLPIDIQYHIDSLVEVHAITGDVAAYAYYFHEGDWRWFDDAHGLDGKRDALVEKYHWWLANKATVRERQACIADALHLWNEHRENLISSLADDCFDVVAKKLEKGRGIKEALSPRTIKRVIRKSDRVKSALKQYADVSAAQAIHAYNSIKEAKENNLSILRERISAREVAEENGRKSEATIARNAKAAHMLKAIAGNETASIYLSGESVHVRGDSVIFQFTKNQEHLLGHGGVEVRLLDFDGNDLCGLCVYFKDTPPAEQVAGFIMMIQSGHENEIIETGNFYSVTARGHEHPTIKSQAKYREDKFANAFADAQGGVPNIIRAMDRAIYGMADDVIALRRKHTPALKNKIRDHLLAIPTFAKLEKMSNNLILA